ncbi:hypothetical protein ACQPZX_41865 [Actinoplanes sp. CA-142083]|uniref:hypothetical protein n=1 Tax=Actinoplanes sp. CA-142083 TaxID=3239903 RepID=UPI003D8A0D2C
MRDRLDDLPISSACFSSPVMVTTEAACRLEAPSTLASSPLMPERVSWRRFCSAWLSSATWRVVCSWLETRSSTWFIAVRLCWVAPESSSAPAEICCIDSVS